MSVAARRVFRLGLVLALSLAFGYGLPLPLPFLAPLFALLLTAAPAPPMGIKGLAGLVLVVLITLGIGLLLIPVLTEYPLSGVLLVAVGLYLSAYITIHLGKALVGTLLTVGVTLISAAGTLSYLLAVTVIQSLVLGIAVAIIMKAVSLAQQGTLVKAKDAGRELLGSTFLGGCFAVVFWFALDLVTNLWMFSLWMLLFGVYFAAKLYQVFPSRYPGSFWLNTALTMLILLGPAVEDSANGKDVYAAFLVRMGLFVAVTLYAWLAIEFLEHLRDRRRRRIHQATSQMELPPC